jgi:alkanesulfonate monooxygenase SsuD/methylene tetrahydromethanopterin reductase-like flavin-dependent oxidoreductase (luciferase family)
MAVMATLGVVCLPYLPPERLRDVAVAADESGLEELWLWEDCFREGGFTSAAAALAWTERLRVGVGLFPVPLRNVAVTAMEAATLHRMFPGRALLGFGHGVQDWMGQVGARAESPVALLREYLVAMRALLQGRTVSKEGRYVRLDGVALDWPPVEPQPLYAGATGPRSLRLSGELADGTILTSGASPDGVRRARSFIDEGRAVASRADEHKIFVYVVAATGSGAADRLRDEYAREGYETPVELAPCGAAETVASALQAWMDAGADTLVLQPTQDDPDPEGFVRFVAREVRPLLTRQE